MKKMKIEFEESKNIMRILKINGIYLIDYPFNYEQCFHVAAFYSNMKDGRSYLMPEIISLVSGYIKDMETPDAIWFSVIMGYLMMKRNVINVTKNNNLLKIIASSENSMASLCDHIKKVYFKISKNIDHANIASLIFYGMMIYMYRQSEDVNLSSFFN